MSDPKVEPEQPPYWAWAEDPDTGRGTVYDATGAMVATCQSGPLARRICFSVNTLGLVPLPESS